jgi:hypothetical protein
MRGRVCWFQHVRFRHEVSSQHTRWECMLAVVHWCVGTNLGCFNDCDVLGRPPCHAFNHGCRAATDGGGWFGEGGKPSIMEHVSSRPLPMVSSAGRGKCRQALEADSDAASQGRTPKQRAQPGRFRVARGGDDKRTVGGCNCGGPLCFSAIGQANRGLPKLATFLGPRRPMAPLN